VKLGDDLADIFAGDPKDNFSYFNYRDTLYSVADGTVVRVKDGRPENHGDARDVTFSSIDEYAGNYLVLDLGQNRYAIYGHCVPNSFFVQVNQTVKEGDPIALLGNSGNSTAPHLHFQICDGPDLFESVGLPFVLKKYFKTGVYPDSLILPNPIEYHNSMMEQYTIIKFEP
jgi:murein DD-endopeptidase MepM/ murein hydrolase activator NlpD